VFKELTDRRVVHAAAAYLATSLVILRLAATLSEIFDLGELFEQILALALVVVFPFAMTWVWRYGGERKAKAQAAKAAAMEVEVYGDGATQGLKLDPQHMRNLLIVIGAVLSLAIVAMVVDRLLPRDEPEPARSAAAAPARSIAVLPFVNMSADAEQE
jgi:predicted MFS family arabinose efflux permease